MLVVSWTVSLVVSLIDSEVFSDAVDVVPLPKGAEVVTGGDVTAGVVSTTRVLEDVSDVSLLLAVEVVVSTPLVSDVVVVSAVVVALVDDGLVVEGLVVAGLVGFVLEELQSKVMVWISTLQVVLV